MESLKLFIISFGLIYLTYLFFVVFSKKRVLRFKDNSYVKFLKNVHKVKVENIINKKLANLISLANSFIISVTLVATNITTEFYLKFVLAFSVLIPLQLLVYFIIAKLLKRGVK